MAWRDSRRSRRRLLLYSTSISLGVAALIAVGSFGDNLRGAIEGQAKTLLGADLAIISNSTFSEEERVLLNSLGGVQAREISFASMVYFPKSNGTRLAQVRALEGDFPFYGRMETVPPTAAAEFRTGSSALVEVGMMKQFGVSAGDTIKVGESTFVIRGSLEKVPGEMAAFTAMAPRVYIALADLEKTGLLKKGSLVRHRVYFKFDPEVDVSQLVRKLRPKLIKFQLEVDTVEQRKRELGRAMTNLSHFLNLVGFVALLLGGIGVASAIHVHIKQKLATVAILRSLGCTSSQAFSIYLLQGVALGLAGVLSGAVLGIVVQMGLPRVLSDFVPIDFPTSLAWSALARGAGLGMVICLLFALLPLLAVRRVSPLAVFRSSVEHQAGGQRDPLLWVGYALLAGGLISFSISQSRSWEHGLWFAGAIGLAFAFLATLAKLTTIVVRRYAARVGVFTWRQGLASLYRPDNRTVLLMLSLGLGTFLVLSLYLLQGNLVREVLPGAQQDRPDAVLFDIQSDQKEEVAELLQAQGLPVLQDVPVVTMRLAEVKGRPVERIRKDPRRDIPNWALRREYRSTYRDRLDESEKLVAGVLHERVPSDISPVPVSVEDGIARTLKVGLGDELVFDVQGVPIKTVIASLREVEWRRLQPNFFVVFPLGVLEEAPSFHVMVTRAGSPERSAQMQQAMVKRFPNISTVDLGLILQTVDSILSKISFVIQFMALFTVGTGLLVLVASILTGRYQRLRESILLRTLGASRNQIRQILVVEYFCLGSLAAAMGILLSAGASWALAEFVFKIPFRLSVTPLLVAWIAVSGLTVLAGLLTSRGIGSHPPLEILRNEL